MNQEPTQDSASGRIFEKSFVGANTFFRQIAFVTAIGFLLSTVLRFVFLYMAPPGSRPALFDLLGALGEGLLFDVSTAIYWLIPLFLAYTVLPARALRRDLYSKWFLGFVGFVLFIWTLASLSEVVFWNEFNSRFNFIAVDYLVYTHEVLQNIWESYPLVWLLLGVFLFSLLLVSFTKRTIAVDETRGRLFANKMLVALIGVILFAGNYFLISENLLPPSTAHVKRELTKNGLASLFAAYFHNQIDYDEFYVRIPEKEAFARLRRHLMNDLESKQGSETNEPKVKNRDAFSIARWVTAPSALKTGSGQPINVMMVVMESMSARFMGAYDPGSSLTPNLDRLSREGLFFRHLYATGTRTVRGLEAVTLSVPPTPGQSIVRRPGNERLYSLGSVLAAKGYKTSFVYGGDAFFDNMKAFYSENGFAVHDETTMKSEEISFKNAWGVCDEDLFNMAIREADHAQTEKKPFLQVIMTTSNHRPYTFPNGKVNFVSGSGRDGAVKYSDYAVGELIKNAHDKPWFKNTLFVFVSDHNASVSGGVDVPVADYLIPAIIYNPNLVQPKTVETLGSQIDLAPTLLSMMGVSYESHFFGHDLLTATDERAFLSNYQRVGFLRKGQMVLLSPPRKVDRYEIQEDPATHLHVKQTAFTDPRWDNDENVKDAIAYYQSASYLFKNQLMQREAKDSAPGLTEAESSSDGEASAICGANSEKKCVESTVKASK